MSNILAETRILITETGMVDTGHNRLAVAKGCCVEAPIEHVKLGGIEIKFRDEIDGSSDIGKLAHQLKKVLVC